jgi:hypothetical protein
MKGKKKRQRPRRRHSPVGFDPTGGTKMSEVLREFVAPFEPDDITDEELVNLLGTGMVAWNLAMMPEATRREQFDALVKPMKLSRGEKKELWAVVEQMIQRKLERYAGIDRIILDFELTADEDTINIRVLSTIPPPPDTATS